MTLRLSLITCRLLCYLASWGDAFIVPHLLRPTSLQHHFIDSIRLHASTYVIGDTSIIESRESLSHISSVYSRLEPLLTSFLLRAVYDTSDHDEDEVIVSFFRLEDAYQAMLGLLTWDTSLRKGRLPLPSDFETTGQEPWPPEPLFTHIQDALSTLALPRLVRRHPEILPSVLLGVAKVVVEFINMQRQGILQLDDGHHEIEGEEGECNIKVDDLTLQFDDLQDHDDYVPLSEDQVEQLAQSLSDKLSQEWSGVVRGVSMLDNVFGYNHQLLDLKGETGFGLQDGIWQHKGWAPLPTLQDKLSKIPELRELLSKLGKRPSTEGKISRFKSRKRSTSPNDMLGVEVDRFDPTSVTGLCYSSSLTAMLPSEAVFLQSRIKALKLLFLAKKAESKLLSYDFSGYTDINTLPLPKKRKTDVLPSATGGPIIICLDTSWSMTGIREQLAKAVVLSSVQAATRQGRECKVVSFSSANNVVESGTISCDADGVMRLLDFLQSSFGGGTDVTGALKFVIESLEKEMSSSDIILVSDGEIPNPPVSNILMAKLECLKQLNNVEVHGLLIGKKESPALSSLCNSVHDFLFDYELINYKHNDLLQQSPGWTSTTLYAQMMPQTSFFKSHLTSTGKTRRYKRQITSLHAHRTSANHEFHIDFYSDQADGCKLQRKNEIKSNRKRRFQDDEEDWLWNDDGSGNQYIDSSSDLSASRSQAQTNGASNGTFVQRLECTFESLQKKALQQITREDVSSEIERSTLYSKMSTFSNSISFVQSGLVERDGEARLVVLGLVSQEHVLFIGPPGTSKSELGRRLSQLCGGPFFQRLFTRFTTPEEIYGPLSLRALENDEYLRCIDGFLPMATVAFLDEIFKANSSILNTLLTILNERQFDNGAGNRVNCPLKCVIGASNELPESEELDALLDRFLLRAQVNPVSDEGLLKILSQAHQNRTPPPIDIAGELNHVVSDISSMIDMISLDQNICVLIQKLRTFTNDVLGMYISDRRLVKASRLLRVSAATHGRLKVDLVDCLLLENVIWQIPEQQTAIREWLLDNLTPASDIVEQSRFLLSGLTSEALKLVVKTGGDITGDSGARSNDVDAIKAIKDEIVEIRRLLEIHYQEIERHIALVDNLPGHLWISQDSSHLAQQYLAPLARARSEAVRDELLNAESLQLVLSDFIENDLRSSLIEMLMENEAYGSLFTEDELNMSLKDAKRKYDGDTLRKWKIARRKLK